MLQLNYSNPRRRLRFGRTLKLVQAMSWTEHPTSKARWPAKSRPTFEVQSRVFLDLSSVSPALAIIPSRPITENLALLPPQGSFWSVASDSTAAVDGFVRKLCYRYWEIKILKRGPLIICGAKRQKKAVVALSMRNIIILMNHNHLKNDANIHSPAFVFYGAFQDLMGDRNFSEEWLSEEF